MARQIKRKPKMPLHQISSVESNLLPLRVHDLKQWSYCSRIVFYNYVTPVEMKPTYKMKHGRFAEDTIASLEKRRKLSEFGLAEGTRTFHVLLTSAMLGLSGRIDLLIEDHQRFYPVDFKASERQVYENHIIQLSGYALLLEEQFGTVVERGFIFLIPNDEIVPIELSRERKDEALRMLTEIRLAIQHEAMPEPTPVRTRCEECEYRNYCGDVF